ncbi:MAG: response regulator transcription factor [Phaeodactylibacter sp.]|nr:response regulator transcription factor [Phaeodactylibacter sp.]
MNKKEITVFLVDDHQVVLDGLQLLLKGHPQIGVVGAARNGSELLERLKQMRESGPLPGVILMDINMPGMDGLEATRRVRAEYPEVSILMLTMRDDKQGLDMAIASGANGFLSKSKGKAEIVDAIIRVAQGEFVVFADFEK